MTGKVPFSRVPLSDLKDRPEQQWSQSVVGGLNQSMLALSQGTENVQIKVLDISVPQGWINYSTFQGAWTGSIDVIKHYDGSVQISGYAQGGVYGTNVFTLPDGCWPARNTRIAQTAGGAFGAWSIGTDGTLFPIVGAGRIYIHTRFMPSNNRPNPLSCFPVNIKTKFKKKPKAVLCIGNQRFGDDGQKPTCQAGQPQWRFINTPQGPTVQILNINGLEYGCRQKVTVAIIGG